MEDPLLYTSLHGEGPNIWWEEAVPSPNADVIWTTKLAFYKAYSEAVADLATNRVGGRLSGILVLPGWAGKFSCNCDIVGSETIIVSLTPPVVSAHYVCVMACSLE